MLRVLGVALAAGLSLMGCESECGVVRINGVAENPDIAQVRDAMGSVRLSEICGTDYGAFAGVRTDLGLVILNLDANVPSTDLKQDLALSRVVLPAASVVFWSAHLKPGTSLSGKQLAGGGLHKQSEAALYQTYALTTGTLTVVEGPRNHQAEIDPAQWTEEWHLKWSLEYGSGAESWSGDDWVKFSPTSPIGSPAFFPSEPKP